MSDAPRSSRSNPVQIAAKLYDIRDYLRTLLGARFQAEMAALGDRLEAIASERGEDLLSVALRAAQGAISDSREVSAWKIIAAAVERLEPSAPVEVPLG